MFNHWNAFDFRIVQYEGKGMLSLIFPHDNNREGVILDNNYEILKSVDLRGDLKQSNMHDFTVVDNGANALTLDNDPGPASKEQSRVVGFEGNCKAAWEGFKEIRVSDNEVLFNWTAREWIGLDESTFIPNPPKEQCKSRWDILHLNSIDKFPDGDYLVSSRHMDALYKVSHVDGHIVWRLGGKKSDFKLREMETHFSRQHHARVRGQNETHTMISLFDNAHGDGPAQAEKPSNSISRGLLLALRTDTQPMTAELAAHYDHPRGGITNSRGSMQFLPNGNIFMGWTYSSRQSEHTPDGRLLMESHFRLDSAHSYRNYKYPWVGHPSKPPDAVSAASNHHHNTRVSTMVHVSWNGATEVKTWRLYKSNADGKYIKRVSTTLRQGFESALSFDGYAAFVIVEALDKDDNVLPNGKSGVIKTSPPKDMDNDDVIAETQWLQYPPESDSIRLDDEEGFWPSLSSALQAPPAIFFSGFACAVVVCCVALWASKRPKASWWRRVYRPLAGDDSIVDERHSRYREGVEEFELDSDGEEPGELGGDESSKLVAQRRVDQDGHG